MHNSPTRGKIAFASSVGVSLRSPMSRVLPRWHTNIPNLKKLGQISAAEAMRPQDATTATSSNSESEESYGHSVTRPLNSGHDVLTYICTALAVLAAYGHLLLINISYIKIVIIPVIMLAFIGAVGVKCYSMDRLQYNNNSYTGFVNSFEMLVALVAVTAVTCVPQILQILSSGLDKIVGQQNDSFLISHFLFFFSSAVGALQVMTATVPVRINPGAAKVSQVFQMTCSVVLIMAVHAKATEWVGEDMVLVCMPELIAALIWLTIHLDHGGYTIRIDKVISLKSGVIIASAVIILVSMVAYRRKVPAKLYTRILVSCTLSGMLSCFSKWTISESGNSAKVPIQLLEFSAHICFVISTILVLVLAIMHLELQLSHQEITEKLLGSIDNDTVIILSIVVASVLLTWWPVVRIKAPRNHSIASIRERRHISSGMSMMTNKLCGRYFPVTITVLSLGILIMTNITKGGKEQWLVFMRR